MPPQMQIKALFSKDKKKIEIKVELKWMRDESEVGFRLNITR